ncbi:phosphatase PAP2 family protein [Vibrio sp. 10N.286.49.B3]|uniref:phosphatase PAP2 family protein n=1 Tax=Vibrio sp. 10N.286.49.B3 TaxID=1880855 RepID=UPI0012FFD5F0|nr:phosphatase PAP2 family protein [Vibrio sp. 10N.286.49.B3]
MILAIFTLLLFPVIYLNTNGSLTSPVNDSYGLFISLLTDSAGSRGFLITLAVLCLMTLSLKLNKATLLRFTLALAFLLITSFATKSILKHVTQQPRPYVEFLQQEHIIPDTDTFYRAELLEKNLFITEATNNTSTWRTRHWLGETNYSFPSGHTIFVAICIIFFGGIFAHYRCYAFIALLLTWGLGVSYTRLWLGMHHPFDLLASTLCAALLFALMPTNAIQRWLVSKKLSK